MKELREFIRYSLENGSDKSAYVEIEGARRVKGIIIDLSTGGFSFSIDMNNVPDFNFDMEKFLFVRINFNKFSISAEIEKKWSIVRNGGVEKVFIAGVGFKVISNEDRLRLNEIIEYLRSVSPVYSSKSNNRQQEKSS